MKFHDISKIYGIILLSLPLNSENRPATHNIYNLRYYTPKEIMVVFHDGSN